MAQSPQAGAYLLQETGQLVEMIEQPYDSEALLQGLLSRYPSLLAGNQIDPESPRKWLLISREFGIPGEQNGSDRWAVDHLFIDQDAIPTLVEVKRSSDTRIRREVVGQMLDYAANSILHWPIETLRARFSSQCEREKQDPAERLTEFLEEEQTPEEFWQAVKTNLQAGKVRLLFVADQIPSELRRVVELLNRQMDPAEVLAIEVRQYVGQGLKTLVPRVMGQTAEAEQKKGHSSSRKQWDEPSFLAELEARQGLKSAEVARKILEWAQQRVTRIYWGQGYRSGSFVPILEHKGRDHQLFAIYTYGTLEVYFGHYQNKPPFDSLDKRTELLRRLNTIPGIQIPSDALTRRPGIPLDVLTEPARLLSLLATFDWFIAEVKSS
ncbi:MAG: hypothetical protein KGJ82_12315 [Nitrospirota bacterium]|nr:hypothetical protein [Nitrospirota bacterium]